MSVSVFCLFLVFQEIGTKRSSNTPKLFDDFFLDKRDPASFGMRPDVQRGDSKALGRVQVPCGPLMAPTKSSHTRLGKVHRMMGIAVGDDGGSMTVLAL